LIAAEGNHNASFYREKGNQFPWTSNNKPSM